MFFGLQRRLADHFFAKAETWGELVEEHDHWLGDGQMAVEYGGQTLSRYDVSLSREARLEAVTNPRLFVTPYATTQPKLFALDALGEGGWLKALRLDEYAVRRRRPEALQQPLFPYLEAL
ncbi:MAG: hypothetical protein H0X71_11005 [Rubrobacter sp.]|nr:hypothetical protein [Rubrobacter sp.]